MNNYLYYFNFGTEEFKTYFLILDDKFTVVRFFITVKIFKKNEMYKLLNICFIIVISGYFLMYVYKTYILFEFKSFGRIRLSLSYWYILELDVIGENV